MTGSVLKSTKFGLFKRGKDLFSLGQSSRVVFIGSELRVYSVN